MILLSSLLLDKIKYNNSSGVIMVKMTRDFPRKIESLRNIFAFINDFAQKGSLDEKNIFIMNLPKCHMVQIQPGWILIWARACWPLSVAVSAAAGCSKALLDSQGADRQPQRNMSAYEKVVAGVR